MNIQHRPKLVLLGMMSKMPVAGVVWQTVHYLLGFQRLGFDVYYVEAHGATPRGLMDCATDDAWAKAAAFIDGVCRRFDLGDKWAFHARFHDERVYGLSDAALAQLYQDAALIINLHGGTVPLPEHYASGRLVFLETDPVELQIELSQGRQAAIDYLAPHCAFFTFGENYAQSDCLLPVCDRFHFKPTRQPVLMDLWDVPESSPGPAFTTIGNWEQSHRQVHFRGEVYHWSKHFEFLKFIDLPSRAKSIAHLELALASHDDAVQKMLTEKGWSVRPAKDFSMNPDAYHRYITSSRGEFTVAKDQNVRLRSGWFSDRSATYLAAGRPVITQDTAFGNIFPTGKGLFSFQTMENVLQALDAIHSDYDGNCRAARAIAHEYFSHEIVLGNLLREVGF